jgi:oxaloacetate decarboxylase
MPTPRPGPRQAFRAVLAGNACVHPGSVFDAPSAVLAESLGFECAIFAGSIASLSVLAAPDLIVLTLSEFAEQARRICRVTDLPLVVDADHGYGNALNVQRCVEELEAAGIAAMTIEDTDLPRPYGTTKASLVSREEGLGKVRAALAARRDPSLVIAGRTSALDIAGMEEALARVTAYAEAGADAVFLTGVKTIEQIRDIAAHVRVPIMLGGTPPSLDSAELAQHGVRFRILGHQPYMAALNAAYETLRAIRAGTKPADLTGLLPPNLHALAERRVAHDAATKDFLGGQK